MNKPTTYSARFNDTCMVKIDGQLKRFNHKMNMNKNLKIFNEIIFIEIN